MPAGELEHKLVRIFLPPEAQQEYEEGLIERRWLDPLAALIREMSEEYVAPARPGISFSTPAAAAYALYYGQITYAKLGYLLGQLDAFLSGDGPLRILDYGCGPGVGAAAVIEHSARPLDIVAVDSSTAMLAAARNVITGFHERSNLRCRFERDAPLAVDKYDLIIAANVLNELARPESFVLRCCQALAPSGLLLILEPALQSLTRRLMQLRDRVLADCPGLSVIFPCTRAGECPMLRLSGVDWCHGAMDWEVPQLVWQLDRLTGFNKHRLKYAALVLSNGGPLQAGYRVVSVPQKQKHALSATLCSAGYYGPVTLPKRARNAGNRSCGRLKLYDRVAVSGRDERGRLDEESRVEILGKLSPFCCEHESK